jgi:hypothetical protein
MTRRGSDRRAIAEEAARLMYREGVRQYFDAKRIAARRILGKDGTGARLRHEQLPSNGEIRDALLVIARLAEGADRSRRLFAMRAVALELMQVLEPWNPRLIGSVATGHVRAGSDIDLHVFGERDAFARFVHTLGWATRTEEVEIRVGDDLRLYTHVHLLDRPFPVELSIYPDSERRVLTRSSTDGRPIDRVSPARLRERVEAEHPAEYAHWRTTGAIDWEERALPANDFAGLLADLQARQVDL